MSTCVSVRFFFFIQEVDVWIDILSAFRLFHIVVVSDNDYDKIPSEDSKTPTLHHILNGATDSPIIALVTAVEYHFGSHNRTL